MAKLTVLYGQISQKQIVPTIIILCVGFFLCAPVVALNTTWCWLWWDAAVSYYTTLG